MVAHTISNIVNLRPVLQNCGTLPTNATSVLNDIYGDASEKTFLQYECTDGEKYGFHDSRPYYLMDPSGLAPGKYLLVSTGFGRAFTTDQVCLYISSDVI